VIGTARVAITGGQNQQWQSTRKTNCWNLTQ